MKQFEYKVVEITNRSIFDSFNELGSEGWELVSVEGIRCYFKREIVEEPEREVTVEQVLHDIEIGRTETSTRIRVMLQWAKARYLKDVTFPTRNFGEKSKREWRELIEKYYGRKC